MTDTDTRISGANTAPRDSRGRFGPGNPGKRRGARNKATVAALGLLDKGSKQLMQKAVDLALAGDSTALRLCIERIAPPSRERALAIDLPVPKTAADVPDTLRAILRAAAQGDITSGEAERLSRTVETFARAHELADFDARLRALEAGNAQ
ncbi:hypothetical protein [Pseudoxanthomonas sp. JBR18]|uniref:hypothetical protein n=1 Tax=Pseudoxanthomonas sp. JBR18 TaxID=2969308 RepID=UPI00230519AE|nr:hypothetical protein [Pseudoxanthomonas sp. JBR18]WCE03167.1 hypothetical protein PJ250_13710 [Pseudoxanthomonas sp. JBR18]